MDKHPLRTPGPYRLHDAERGVVVAVDKTGTGGEICNTLNGFGDQRANAWFIKDALNAYDTCTSELLSAACALGAMPEGYCFCSENRIGDDSKVHEPECQDMRDAIAEAKWSFGDINA